MPEVRRRRGLSVRLRLTLSYAGFLVASGALLFAVLFAVLRFLPDENLVVARGQGFAPNRSDLIEVAVPVSLTGLGLLAVIGLGGGWILAGRMLRPLAELHDAARVVAAGSLSHRVRLPGPDDEFRQLADQFDRMLDRLEHAFEEQRRFTHHASHELRTPLAITKTMLEVALADPGEEDRSRLLGRLAEMNERSIDILESLFQLARLGRVDLETAEVDLAEIVAEAAGGDVRLDGLSVTWDLESAPVRGNRAMLVQLADNLLRNVGEHAASSDARAWVTTGVREGRGVLVVENTGEVLHADLVATLTEPFVSGRRRRTTSKWATGTGLGLAIVASVARVHGADLTLAPRVGGGLRVVVSLAAGSPAHTLTKHPAP